MALVRLLLKSCSIILIDGPTGSLGEKSRDEVLALLRDDSAIMQACDQVITIDRYLIENKTAADDRPEDQPYGQSGDP